MVLLLVATVGLIVAAVLALLPAAARQEEEPETPAVRPSSLEGVLVEQLIGGQISRRQYLRAVERIAARDDHRHPLTIPECDMPE